MTDKQKIELVEKHEKLKNTFHSEIMFQHLIEDSIESWKSSKVEHDEKFSQRLEKLDSIRNDSIQKQQIMLVKIKAIQKELLENHIPYKPLYIGGK